MSQEKHKKQHFYTLSNSNDITNRGFLISFFSIHNLSYFLHY
jgi:hypothetical protein